MSSAYNYESYAGFKESGIASGTSKAKQLARRLGLRNRYLRFLDGVDRTLPVVEIGCGPGEFLAELKSVGFQTTLGVDVCPAYASEAITVGDATEFIEQQRDKSLGAIVALDVLEHLEQDEIRRLLDLVRKKLAPGGRFLLRSPNAASPIGLPNQYGDLSHRVALTELAMKQLAYDAQLACESYPEPRAYPRSPLALAGLVLWPAYRLMTRAALAAFGQKPNILTPNLVCVLTLKG